MKKKLKNTINKREVTNLVNKLTKELVSLKSIIEVESLIMRLVPDAQELQNDLFNENISSEFSVWFIIPREYIGKHSLNEYEKSVDDFLSLVNPGESITVDISRENGEFNIKVYAFFKYLQSWKKSSYGSLEIKNETVKIPLEFRKSEVDKIFKDIAGLSSGTISKLISEENIGEASNLYILIDKVKEKFLGYASNYIKTVSLVPTDWRAIWYEFKKENSIVQIAKNLDIDENKITPNYNEILAVNEKLLNLKNEFNDLLKLDDINLQFISKDLIKNLTYAYALSVLKQKYIDNKTNSINKIINSTIPNILNNGYNEEFYIENCQKGIKVLKAL